jgi:N-methylhydantoinase A
LRGGDKPGPFLVDEYDSTIVVPPGCSARLDRLGNVEVTVHG